MLNKMAWAAAIGGFVLVLAAAEGSAVQQDPPSTTDPERIVDWLLENPLLVGVIVTVVVLFVKIGRWTEKVDSAAKDFRSFVKKSFPDFQDEIRSAIADLMQRIPLRTVRRGSPLELTDFGRLIAAKLEANEWATAVAKDLEEQLAGLQPFEIDAACVEYLEQQLDTEYSRRVAAVAYDLGVSEDGVLDVLRVVLRDELLQRLGLAEPPSGDAG